MGSAAEVGYRVIVAAVLHCVVIAGLGGEAEFEQRFSGWAQTLENTMRSAGPDVKAHVLQGKSVSKDAIRTAFDSVRAAAKPEDSIAVFLIGHGSYDGVDYKFNIPGPDITDSDLAVMLGRVPALKQLIVNMTSASGAALDSLGAPNRVVISATKSGNEKNAPVFPRYMVDALRDAGADTDKNEVITAGEAFRYAETKTKQFYETQKRIATEHPMMSGGDARFVLLRIGSVQAVAQQPEKRALLDKREELERKIDDLKLRKAAMPVQQYRQELQTLLLELARTQQELDK
ncbi:MAG TPA: hypothetical protein VFL57_15070 [Bryobacteraceae bacterium]|nr:hypothetical protein [Bryobacteraceae bacterium]